MAQMSWFCLLRYGFVRQDGSVTPELVSMLIKIRLNPILLLYVLTTTSQRFRIACRTKNSQVRYSDARRLREMELKR